MSCGSSARCHGNQRASEGRLAWRHANACSGIQQAHLEIKGGKQEETEVCVCVGGMQCSNPESFPQSHPGPRWREHLCSSFDWHKRRFRYSGGWDFVPYSRYAVAEKLQGPRFRLQNNSMTEQRRGLEKPGKQAFYSPFWSIHVKVQLPGAALLLFMHLAKL